MMEDWSGFTLFQIVDQQSSWVRTPGLWALTQGKRRASFVLRTWKVPSTQGRRTERSLILFGFESVFHWA